jgi:hypothetical protein
VHVVAVAGDVVVKLYQPVSDEGMDSFEIETPPLPIKRLLIQVCGRKDHDA